MVKRNPNATADTNEVVLIANSRLIRISFIMVFLGALGGILGVVVLLDYDQNGVMGIFFSILVLLEVPIYFILL